MEQFISGLAKYGIPTLATVLVCRLAKKKRVNVPTWFISVFVSGAVATLTSAADGAFMKSTSVALGDIGLTWVIAYAIATLFYESIWKKISVYFNGEKK